MSSVNYNLNNKGVRLINSQQAWVVGKNNKHKLNPKYYFVGKINMTMTNMIVTASDNKKPQYRGDVSELNRTAKNQIIEHFYNIDGTRNKKAVAYLGIEKKIKNNFKGDKKQ